MNDKTALNHNHKQSNDDIKTQTIIIAKINQSVSIEINVNNVVCSYSTKCHLMTEGIF